MKQSLLLAPTFQFDLDIDTLAVGESGLFIGVSAWNESIMSIYDNSYKSNSYLCFLKTNQNWWEQNVTEMKLVTLFTNFLKVEIFFNVAIPVECILIILVIDTHISIY